MEKEQYLATQMAIIQIGKNSSGLDIDGFLAAISKAETLAPILDPTLYRKGADNLDAIKNLARSIKPVQEAFQKAFEAVIKTAVADMPSLKEHLNEV